MTDVLIYTTQVCPHSRKLKKFLKENRIDFIEKDVSNNEKFLKEMLEKTGKALVPVIDFGDDVFIGFDSNVKEDIMERFNKQDKGLSIKVKKK